MYYLYMDITMVSTKKLHVWPYTSFRRLFAHSGTKDGVIRQVDSIFLEKNFMLYV